MKDTFEVKDGPVIEQMRDLGNRIHGALEAGRYKRKMGFALFLFEFGEEGACFYISDAQRADMLKVLLEFIERQTPPEGSKQ